MGPVALENLRDRPHVAIVSREQRSAGVDTALHVIVELDDETASRFAGHVEPGNGRPGKHPAWAELPFDCRRAPIAAGETGRVGRGPSACDVVVGRLPGGARGGLPRPILWGCGEGESGDRQQGYPDDSCSRHDSDLRVRLGLLGHAHTTPPAIMGNDPSYTQGCPRGLQSIAILPNRPIDLNVFDARSGPEFPQESVMGAPAVASVWAMTSTRVGARSAPSASAVSAASVSICCSCSASETGGSTNRLTFIFW